MNTSVYLPNKINTIHVCTNQIDLGVLTYGSYININLYKKNNMYLSP